MGAADLRANLRQSHRLGIHVPASLPRHEAGMSDRHETRPRGERRWVNSFGIPTNCPSPRFVTINVDMDTSTESQQILRSAWPLLCPVSRGRSDSSRLVNCRLSPGLLRKSWTSPWNPPIDIAQLGLVGGRAGTTTAQPGPTRGIRVRPWTLR